MPRQGLGSEVFNNPDVVLAAATRKLPRQSGKTTLPAET